MRRRGLLRAAAGAGTALVAGLAGCSTDDPADAATDSATRTPTGTPTAEPTPSATPACGDTTHDDEGEFSFEYGLKTGDGTRYDGTVRFVHVRTPPCRYEDPACAAPETETVLAEREYRITDRTKFDIVDAPVTADVDSYRVEFTVDGRTVTRRGLEEAARPLVDGEFDFLVCDPGARRFGFVVRDGRPVVVRARPQG